MEDPTAHLSTDLGKAIWYLQNSLRLLDFSHEFSLYQVNAAIDNRIKENLEKKSRGEPPNTDTPPEIINLQKYEKEICDEIRGALFVGHRRSIELPSCKRLALSIESRHVSGTPDFRTFIFDALTELETLLVAVESLGASSADELISADEAGDVKPLGREELEIEVLKVLAKDKAHVWTKQTMAAEINKDRTKKTSPSSVYNTNAMKIHLRDKGQDRGPRKPDLDSEELVHHLAATAKMSPQLKREILSQHREMQSEKGLRIKGNLVKSRD